MEEPAAPAIQMAFALKGNPLISIAYKQSVKIKERMYSWGGCKRTKEPKVSYDTDI